MTESRLRPSHRCPACGGGHYVAVRFCPFCGAAQARPEPVQEPTPTPDAPQPAASPTPRVLHLDVAQAPNANAAPDGISPPPAAAAAVADPEPARPAQAEPSPSRPYRRRTRRNWVRTGVLAGLAIAGLAALALGRRDGLPGPAQIVAGPNWTAVALTPFRAAPLLRFTGDGPFSLRLDGERVLRVAPGGGASLRLKTIRGLEVRAARGAVAVTLTPRGE